MFYAVFVSPMPAPPAGELDTEAGANSWKCLTQGNCAKRIAVDFAQNCIRFGGWARAAVFAGRGAIGREVYQVVRDDSPEE